MFKDTSSCLEMARVHFDNMCNSKNGHLYQTYYSAFITTCRRITWTMQKEGRNSLSEFEDWYNDKKEEMSSDELLRFMKKERNSIEKKGSNSLKFKHDLKNIHFKNFPIPPKGISAESWGADERGFFWTEKQGTRKERQIPFEDGYVSDFHVEIENPPKTHLGSRIRVRDPEILCKKVLTYFENLVFEFKGLKDH